MSKLAGSNQRNLANALSEMNRICYKLNLPRNVIETSSITGHFSEHWKKAYINIFSCLKYDHELAEKFTKEYFGAKTIKSKLLVR